MKRWKVSELPRERYHEMMRAADMSLGVYRIGKDAEDTQKLHTEDEVYFVLAGRARLTSGGETTEVAAGDVLFVAAREKHHFHDVEADLALLVVFAPAERSRALPTG